MKRRAFFLLLAVLLCSLPDRQADAQTPYVPTCLTAAQQQTVSTSAAALAPLLNIDLTDSMMRLADQNCALQRATTGALADIQTLKQNYATLQAQVSRLQAQLTSQATGVVTINADSTITTAFPALATPDAGGDNKKIQFNSNGLFADYNVTIPQAGNYAIAARVATETTVNAEPAFHLESPPGTTLTSGAFVSGAWKTIVLGPVALPAGQITLRFFVDSTAGSIVDLHWLQLTKQ